MMLYVLDNNIFSRSLNNLSVNVFPEIWVPWNAMVETGRIISVDEVYCELEQRYGDNDVQGQWLKGIRAIFQKPCNAEGKIIAEIYQNSKYREGVKEKSIRSGSPEADAMLVAKAKIMGGIVVTTESDAKPNSEKIPNICTTYNVPYMTQDGFYRVLKNVHSCQTETTDVTIQYELGHAVPLCEDELVQWISMHRIK